MKLENTSHKGKALDLCPGTGEFGEGDFACRSHSPIPVPKGSFVQGTSLLPLLCTLPSLQLPSSKTLMLLSYTLSFTDFSSEFHSSLGVLLTPTDGSKET